MHDHAPDRDRPREIRLLSPERSLRLEWLLVLTALVLVVWVYPLYLREEWLIGIGQWLQARGRLGLWLWERIDPMIEFSFSPLVLRGAPAVVALLFFAVLAGGRWLLTTVDHSPLDDDRVFFVGGRRVATSGAVLLGWLLLSAAWSVTPDISRTAAAWTAIFGLPWLVLVCRGISRRERRQLAVWMPILGCPVLVVLFLQALPIFGGVIFNFMYRFSDLERNLFGSLLGHNTAAASFLMLTMFPAAALLMTARVRWMQVLLGLYLMASAFGMLLLQSRSVWILAPILFVLALRSMLRQVGWHGRRWVPTVMLLMLAAGLISQTIDRPWNPFYVRNPSLAQRLHALSIDGLLMESRLRLNVIGIRLVPDAPLIGHGLHTFQYVYPKKHGEYFRTHLDSRLQQTELRSNMAHNEYLQVLIEQGIVGLALLLWLLVELGRRGRELLRAETGPDRMLRESFGWSALAIGLHGLVDFPFHIPQLLLPGLICAAAWATDRRERVAGVAPMPEIAEDEDAASFRPRVFVRLLAAMALAVGAVFASSWLMIQLQGDVLANRADALRRAFEREVDQAQSAGGDARVVAQRQFGLLQASDDLYRRAAALTPSNYLIYNGLTQVQYFFGWTARMRAELLDAQGDAQGAVEARGQAVAHQKQALQLAYHTRQGLNYHALHYLTSMIYAELERLEPGHGHFRQRIAMLRMTLDYNPVVLQAAYELAELLQETGLGSNEEVLALRRHIYRVAPAVFNAHYVMRANRFTDLLMNEEAALAREQILQVDPTNQEWLAETGNAQALAGNPERAKEIFALILELDFHAYFTYGSVLYDNALRGNWNDVLYFTLSVSNQNPQQRAVMAALERAALERAAEPDRVEPYLDAPPGMDEADWERLVAERLPEVLWAYVTDPQAARDAHQRRLEMEGEPDLRFWIAGVRIGLALGDGEMVRSCLEAARAIQPGAPVLAPTSRLSQQIREAGLLP